MTEWVEVLTVLVDGPKLPVRGTVTTIDPTEPQRNFGWAGDPPLMVSLHALEARVWRSEARVRIEIDGQPYFITDGADAWRFRPKQPIPLHSRADRVSYHGPGYQLMVTRDANSWLGNDFTRPTGPIGEIRFLERDCWTVELAPPEHKPHPLQLVIDKESGAVLQHRNDGLGISTGYTEVEVGVSVDDNLFIWTGESRPLDEEWAEQRRVQEAIHAAEKQRRGEWFAEQVANPHITIPVIADLSVQYIHELDETDGSFTAQLGDGRPFRGTLARRPRSIDEWELHANCVVHRWTTADFDWACYLHSGQLDTDSLRQLQRHLHPDEPATNQTTDDFTGQR